MNPGFHECLARGIALFNRRDFYDAHEVWEDGWRDELGDERVLLQGLIQLAAGFYKLQVGAPTGTVKLLENGMRKLEAFRDDAQGVELEPLLAEATAWLAEARRMVATKRVDYDPDRLPKIGYQRPVQ